MDSRIALHPYCLSSNYLHWFSAEFNCLCKTFHNDRDANCIFFTKPAKNIELFQGVFPMFVVSQRCMQGVDQITQHILTTAASLCCFPASLAQRCVLSTCSSWHVCLKGGSRNRRLRNQSGLLFQRSWYPSPGNTTEPFLLTGNGLSFNTQATLVVQHRNWRALKAKRSMHS